MQPLESQSASGKQGNTKSSILNDEIYELSQNLRSVQREIVAQTKRHRRYVISAVVFAETQKNSEAFLRLQAQTLKVMDEIDASELEEKRITAEIDSKTIEASKEARARYRANVAIADIGNQSVQSRLVNSKSVKNRKRHTCIKCQATNSAMFLKCIRDGCDNWAHQKRCDTEDGWMCDPCTQETVDAPPSQHCAGESTRSENRATHLFEWEDITMFQTDLVSLNPDEWIQETILHFQLKILSKRQKDQKWGFLTPSEVAMLPTLDADTVQSLFTCHLMLLPLSNWDPATQKQGTHWSLLILNTQLAEIYHYDSNYTGGTGLNDKKAKATCTDLSNKLGINLTLKEINGPKQPSSKY